MFSKTSHWPRIHMSTALWQLRYPPILPRRPGFGRDRHTAGIRISAILPCTMSGKKRDKEKRPVFDSIRKPTAPPGHKFGDDKPEEKAHPSGRKVKHKKKIEADE